MRHHQTSTPLADTRHADPLAALGDPSLPDGLLTPAETTGSRPLDAAQQELVLTHIRLGYRLAWRFARHELRDMPADELIAEAMFALTYAAGLYDPLRDVPFHIYAGIVIRHRLTQSGRMWRKHKRLTQSDVRLDTFAKQPQTPTEAVHTRQVCEQIRAFLPKRWYDVLWLHYTEGLTLDEIGSRLGVTKQRAKSIINKAIMRARVHIDGWGSVC